MEKRGVHPGGRTSLWSLTRARGWPDRGSELYAANTPVELPERFAKGRQCLESLGGKLVDIYAVSGPYDLVGIFEAPDEKAAMKHGLFIAQTGYVEIVTMPATADLGLHEHGGGGAEALSAHTPRHPRERRRQPSLRRSALHPHRHPVQHPSSLPR